MFDIFYYVVREKKKKKIDLSVRKSLFYYCFLFFFCRPQVRVMEERLQAEWTTHLPDQAEKEQAISKLATQVEEQVRPARARVARYRVR